MSLHVNTITMDQTDEGIIISSEAMVLFSEGSPEFEYIRSLIGQWDHYVSATVPLPNTASKTEVQIGGSVWKAEGECFAYIYGWEPGSSEWIENSCVAIVVFNLPVALVPEVMSSATIRVQIQGDIFFRGTKTIPIQQEQKLGDVTNERKNDKTVRMDSTS